MVIKAPEDPFEYFSLVEEELDTQPAIERQTPPSIDYLIEITNFSKREIQQLYRSFKELWPIGTVDLEQFQLIYASIFPNGDSKGYAELVFKNIDQNRVGTVTFLDFITNYSKIAKGTLDERLDWIFTLYDTNRCGFLAYNEIFHVVKSMYQMMDSSLKPAVLATICRQHVKIVFKNLNIANNGKVSKAEFLQRCRSDSDILASMELFGSFSSGLLNI
ncbi:EF-hand domain-containing protein [Caenorhabditis elegans]|uniref:EF-hand domain-containing protein n=1 Tax=Caenorhabditis elegans TaxID=6239 RepID=A0A4V0ILQ4_CAEEL|nr:EF-hand domain-containing protein [Caenorhabditis elegans]VTW47485.1 EF-hand domain-containing protein [Caenorhabditis elegans]